jgi:hypothetical protein
MPDKEGKKRKRKVRGGAENKEEKQKSGAAPTERQPKNREPVLAAQTHSGPPGGD